MTYLTPSHPCAAATGAASSHTAAGELAAPAWGSYQSAASWAQPASTLSFPIDHKAFGDNLDLHYANAMKRRTRLSQLRSASSAAATTSSAAATAAAAAAASSSPASAAASSSSASSSSGKLRIVSTSFFRCANFLQTHEPPQSEREARERQRKQLRMWPQIRQQHIAAGTSAEDMAALEAGPGGGHCASLSRSTTATGREGSPQPTPAVRLWPAQIRRYLSLSFPAGATMDIAHLSRPKLVSSLWLRAVREATTR